MTAAPSRTRRSPRRSTASACGRSSAPRCRGSRPCRSPRRRTAPASPAGRTAGCTTIRIRCGSPSSIVGSRRRSPRPKSCMSSSGPNASKTSWRSLSVSLSSVSSSWLRTKFAYWHSSETAIVSRSASASGSASWRASESQIACISGKLKSRLTSSASSPPKKSISCSGGRLTSPSSRPSPRRREMNDRRCRRISCGSRSTSATCARVDQERHGVDPEAVDAELEPEPGDLGDLVAHPLVADVQVGLVRVEVVEEPLPGLLVEGPDAVLGVREHDRGLRRARSAGRARRRSRGTGCRARTAPRGTTDACPTCGSRPGR